MRISFNRPPFVGKETEYIKEAVEKNGMICGDGPFTKKCSQWMKERFQTKNVLLTTSCTHALEMAAFLADIQPGDEVIMPSYTFVSTADAFVLRGATCVFVDIRPDTMNIDETKIEEAITEKTKAIVPVHYAGVSCAMDEIMAIAKKYNLKVVEDAAQGVNAFYKGKALGTIGDFGCYSFHETKNYSMGEGGAILFQDDRYLEPAEILREKGTNRSHNKISSGRNISGNRNVQSVKFRIRRDRSSCSFTGDPCAEVREHQFRMISRKIRFCNRSNSVCIQSGKQNTGFHLRRSYR